MGLNQSGQYENPGWQNDTAPALNATELNAMSNAIAGAVEYDRAQTLTAAQARQARQNIYASRVTFLDAMIGASDWTSEGTLYYFDNPMSTLTQVTAPFGFFVHKSNENADTYDMIEAAKIVVEVTSGNVRFICLGTKPTVTVLLRAIICYIG